MKIVVDSNILMRSFSFVEQVGRMPGVRIVVPRAVYTEIRERANLELLKKLKKSAANLRIKAAGKDDYPILEGLAKIERENSPRRMVAAEGE